MGNPNVEQKQAGLMQMKINTRLTALQCAQTLMGTHGYTGIPGAKKNEQGDSEPVWVKPPGAVDHITLLAIAGDIEKYILGDLEDEANRAIEAAKNPPPRIVRP